LHYVEKLTSKKYAKTIYLLCAGNELFVKYQAEGGGSTPCLEVFGVWTGVGVDVSKFFGVRAGAGVLKRGAGVESESEKGDSAHLCSALRVITAMYCGL